MSEWREVNLGKFIYHKKGNAFKSSLYQKSGLTIVRVSDTTDNSIDLEHCKKISPSLASEYKEYELKEGDIIIMTVGSWPENPKSVVGKVVKVPATADGGLLNQNAVRIRSKDCMNQQFLYFRLKDSTFSGYLINNAQVSANQASITLDDIYSFEFLLPPLPEQKAIAEVLSSLDDKIDLFHRQNKTLEQMAEALFRQWFVKEAGEDWKEGVLGDLIVVKYGKDHKKLLNGNIPVYGSGGVMRYAEKALYNLESVLIPRKGTLSNVIYIDEPFWSVDTMFYTEMKKPNLAKFVYHFVQMQDLAFLDVGSAVPSMTTEILNNIVLNIPTDVILKEFEILVTPMYIKMKSNQTQISTLENIRDTLLPKLMSGEVRITSNG